MLGKEEIVSPSLDELKEHYHHILTLLGEDPEREGLLKTPERVAKAMLALTKGTLWTRTKYSALPSSRKIIIRW